MRWQLSVLVLLGAATAAGAGVDDPIARRKSIFKHFSEITKPVVGMIKHQQGYDPQLVRAALGGYLEGTKVLPGLFPPDSKAGGETQAKAAIWDDKARFEGMFAAFGQTSSAAAAAIGDEASFRATMPKVLGACKACHDEFREKN